MDIQQKHSKWKIWSVSFLPRVRRSAAGIWTSPTDTATHGEGPFSFRLPDMLILRKTLPIALRYLFDKLRDVARVDIESPMPNSTIFQGHVETAWL